MTKYVRATAPSTADLEKAEMCERLSFPPEDARHIAVDRLLREYATILRSHRIDVVKTAAARPTNRDLHDAIASALGQHGLTYSGIQEAVRGIQKLYGSD